MNDICKSFCAKTHESQHTDVSGLWLRVMSSGSLREAPRRFKVMAAETERFNHPVDILIHKHELRLPTGAINSTGWARDVSNMFFSADVHTQK